MGREYLGNRAAAKYPKRETLGRSTAAPHYKEKQIYWLA